MTSSCSSSDIFSTQEQGKILDIQWHITTACPNQCKHCYVQPDTKIFPIEKSENVANDIGTALRELDKIGRVYIVGGDPLLYPYFDKFLENVRSQLPDTMISILGNPELLNDKVIDKLKSWNIFSYQMSLDGLEETHDYVRHRGSFKNTLEKVDLLKNSGLRVLLRSTVNQLNKNEIPELFDIAVEKGVDVFGFHRFIPVGNGINIKKLAMIPPQEYKSFLSKMYSKYLEYEGNHCALSVREPLWALFKKDLGLSLNENEKNLYFTECKIDGSTLSINQNGQVLTCMMLPVPIGKVPEQKIKDIYRSSSLLNEMRQATKVGKCGECELNQYCVGCRAMAYSVYNDYFAPDPLCWKKVENKIYNSETRFEMSPTQREITPLIRVV